MPLTTVISRPDEETMRILEELAANPEPWNTTTDRAKTILMSIEGRSIADIAKTIGRRSGAVAYWRRRFITSGLGGVYDSPPRKTPRVYDPVATRTAILDKLMTPPPEGKPAWDGRTLSEALDIPRGKIASVLKAEGIRLSRRWGPRGDGAPLPAPTPAPEPAEVCALYLKPPDDLIVISVPPRAAQDLEANEPGWTAPRDLERDTRRHLEALDLFTTLKGAKGRQFLPGGSGKAAGPLETLESVRASLPPDRDALVILDDSADRAAYIDWAKSHPNVTLLCTKSTSIWLGLAGLWIDVMTGEAPRGSGPPTADQLYEALESFVKEFGVNDKPVAWTVPAPVREDR
jgi:transposase-like protein